MNNISRMLIILIICSFCSNIYADEDVYVEEDENSPEVVQTSLNNVDELENSIVSRTKTDRSEYDFEVFNYVSVKVRSEKSIKEDMSR